MSETDKPKLPTQLAKNVYPSHKNRLKACSIEQLVDYRDYVKRKFETWKRERNRVDEIIREKTGRNAEIAVSQVKESRSMGSVKMNKDAWRSGIHIFLIVLFYVVWLYTTCHQLLFLYDL